MSTYTNLSLCIIPDSLAADIIIEKNKLERHSLGEIEYYYNSIIRLLVIKFGRTECVPIWIGYFSRKHRIYLIRPDRSRFGTTEEIFEVIKAYLKFTHNITEIAYSEFVSKK